MPGKNQRGRVTDPKGGTKRDPHSTKKKSSYKRKGSSSSAGTRSRNKERVGNDRLTESRYKSARGMSRAGRAGANSRKADDFGKLMDAASALRSPASSHGYKTKGTKGAYQDFLDMRNAEQLGSVDEIIDAALAGLPSAPQPVEAQQVDIDALMKMFAGQRDSANKMYGANQEALAKQTQHAKELGLLSAAANAERLDQLAAQQQAAEDAHVQAVRGAQAAGQTDLQAQGVDASIMAAALAAAQGQAASAGTAADAAIAGTKDHAAQANIEAKRDQHAIEADGAQANVDLDQSLMKAMLGINTAEGEARMKAEQFNAQSLQDAQQAAYGADMQNYQMRQGIPDQVMESIGMQNGFATPGRAGAMEGLQGLQVNGPASYQQFMPKVIQQIQGSANPQEAMELVGMTLNAFGELWEEDKEKGLHTKSYDISQPWAKIKPLVDDYFRTDTTQVNPDVYRSMLARRQ